MSNSSPLVGKDRIKCVSPTNDGAYTIISGDVEVVQHFKAKELACQSNKPNERGVMRVDRTFLTRLSCLRSMFGKPLHVNSGSRTAVHNADIGGHISSLHLSENSKYTVNGIAAATMAVDVGVNGWSRFFLNRLIEIAKMLGFSVGHGYDIDEDNIVVGFVHLDLRTLVGLEQTEFYYD